MPLEEVRRISEFARANDVKLHLDGARIWEAVASGAGSLDAYCSLFDSVSLCFSKGLGAPIGSIIVGSKAFIKQSRWVRKSIGGSLRQAGVVTAAAKVAVEETFGRAQDGSDGLLRGSHVRAKEIANMWVKLGGKLEQPTDTNMVWVDLKAAGVSVEEWRELGLEQGLKLGSGRMVVHYQIGEEAVAKLRVVMEKALEVEKKERGQAEEVVGKRTYG